MNEYEPEPVCGDCGKLGPFHSIECPRLPPRQDVVEALREKLKEKASLLDSAQKDADLWRKQASADQAEIERLKADLLKQIDLKVEALRLLNVSSEEQERAELQLSEARDALLTIANACQACTTGGPELMSVYSVAKRGLKHLEQTEKRKSVVDLRADHARGVCDEKTCPECTTFQMPRCVTCGRPSMMPMREDGTCIHCEAIPNWKKT